MHCIETIIKMNKPKQKKETTVRINKKRKPSLLSKGTDKQIDKWIKENK